jgi:hypothetical protein
VFLADILLEAFARNTQADGLDGGFPACIANQDRAFCHDDSFARVPTSASRPGRAAKTAQFVRVAA